MAPMAMSPMRAHIGAAMPPAPRAPSPAAGSRARREADIEDDLSSRGATRGGMRGGRGVGDFFRGIKDAIMGPPAAPPPFASAEPLEAGATPPSEEVTGSIRINNDKRLAIAFAVKYARVWRLPERVKVELADGSTLLLEVDQKHSTANGQFAAGVEIRLVCSLDVKLTSAAVRVIVEYPNEPGWTVELGG